MKILPGLLLVAALVMTPAAPAVAQQDLQLSMRDGRVTLIAENVPVSRILAEWSRIGQATVLNGDKLTGPPVTLHFENQPERDVLEVLLRSAAGYVVAPREVAVANAAVFDRVLILPTSRAPAISAAPPPQFNRPPTPPVPIQPDMDDERPNDPVMPPGATPQMPPGMQPNPNMPDPNMPMTQPTPGMPQAPATQPRPGMPMPTPGGPGGVQPNPYVTQPPPLPPGVRPPGGGGNPDDR
jgi:hypothetical protein